VPDVCFGHGAGDAARLAWGNRATIAPLHWNIPERILRRQSFPANGGYAKAKTTAPLEMPAALIQVSAR